MKKIPLHRIVCALQNRLNLGTSCSTIVSMVESARLDMSVESMSDIRENMAVDTLPANQYADGYRGRIDWGDAFGQRGYG